METEIGDWDWGLGLGTGIGDRDLGLGLATTIGEWGMGKWAIESTPSPRRCQEDPPHSRLLISNPQLLTMKEHSDNKVPLVNVLG